MTLTLAVVRCRSDSHRSPVTMVVGSCEASGSTLDGAFVADCACRLAVKAANASASVLCFIWISIVLFEIRSVAVEGWRTPDGVNLSFSYAGINRIRFEGIISVQLQGNISDPC